MVEVTPTSMVRRQLGRKLGRLREAAGMAGIDVEKRKIASRSKVWRIESGQVPVKIPDVWALCALYGATPEETAQLSKMAENTNKQGWWEDYADVVPDWFQLYFDLEEAASAIRTFEDGIIPGELQTAEYAHAVYRAAQPQDDDDTIARHVKLRLERQGRLFDRSPAPQLTIVLGENVLTRLVGGREVLDAQIAHLRELSQRPQVEIRVLPFAAGAHAAMTGAFRILDFPDDEDPAVAYLETQVGARYLEKPAELDEYRRIFQLIHQQSTPIGEYAP
ncbi:helix-turn-helix domain-containing protein [Actinoplanes sp. NPDC051859]|uniref:helix-turn-helix domain-containing protein n=1 Tax=Actinoplanes sp. NPDC051859 TaxID=3363909 RepID=UPI0037B87B65